jgi:DNA-binding MurR/RpiR family transcriptional regulator
LAVDEQGLLLRLRRNQDDFTSAEKRVVTWILDHPSQTLNLSIEELSQVSGVSEATVVRTVQRIGFAGYPHFKIALAFDLAGTAKGNNLPTFGEVHGDDDLKTIVSKVFGVHMRALSRTLEHIDMERFEAAVEAILHARHLEVLAVGSQTSLVEDMCGKFISTGIQCAGRINEMQQLAAAAVMESPDVLLVFSHSGRVRVLLQAVQIAKTQRATTIGITNFPQSPLAKAVDIPLVTSGDDLVFYNEAMGSKAAQVALVDCLLVGIANRKREDVMRNLYATRKAIESLRV